MKKNKLLTVLCSILFLVVCGCGSAKTEKNDDDIDSFSDTETADNDTEGVSDDGETDTGLPADEDSGNKDASDDSDTFEDKEDPDSFDDIDDQPEIPDEDTTVSEPLFVKQPKSMNIAPRNKSVTLECEVRADGRNISYQWYSSSDGTTDTGTAISGAADPAFETPVYTEKGLRYYYCAAAVISGSGEEPVVLVSNMASVAFTALPTLYINTPDAVEIVSKEEWVKNTEISLVGATDESWNFDKVATSIKGRGNSTWALPKKPYALKLDKKRKIMGMASHKRWVLMANYRDNSFMRNEVALYLSRIFEFGWTVSGEFVDLVLNGEYKGLYWLGEAIKVDKNRVDINDGNPDLTDEEDKDYLVEMALYYDEIVQFKSSVRDLPYIIKNDDYMVDGNDEITSGGAARLERFKEKIENLERLLYPDWTDGMDTNDCLTPDESYAEIIDIDSWAKFWFVNEIMDNRDSGHPRSSYFTFDSTNNVFKAGPVWYFDKSSFRNPSAPQLKTTIYYSALFKSPAFNSRVKELWNEYSGRIDVEPLVESLRSELDVAAEYDAALWGHHDYINTLLQNDDIKTFDQYVDYLKERFESKLSVVNNDIADINIEVTTDVN
jgi:Cobalamin biosynthesis protein CobT (nicotinate-mononucleotide:5, 6-dimethylbenzimidazole phosphoribosyltransferase)